MFHLPVIIRLQMDKNPMQQNWEAKTKTLLKLKEWPKANLLQSCILALTKGITWNIVFQSQKM